VKTDHRDAEKLARLLRSGELAAVWVPDAAHEALRDLVRTREVAKQDLLRARHRLSKLPLRLGQRYPKGGKSWSGRHMAWLRALVLPQPVQQTVKIDYLAEVEHQLERVARLDAELAAVVKTTPAAVRRFIEGLQVLHGVAQITAVTAVAEVGEFSRFPKPRELMAYGGIVPREHSSGGSVRRGAITKTGNARLRRVLVEAAWHCRHAPPPGSTVIQRRRGQPAVICRIADKAQQRLHLRYRRLLSRGKSKQAVVTALGRELLGFMWAIAGELERQPVIAPAA
jgi:transposase